MLAACYCQQAHRYGAEIEPAASLAEDASAKALRLDSELEETRYARAFAVQIRGRLPEAAELYEEVAGLPGDSAEERQMKSFALNNKGYIQLGLGNLRAAEESFKRALTCCVNKMAHANLGELCRRQGRFDAALEEYRKALELDPRYVNATNETGMVHIAIAAAADGVEKKREALARAREWHEHALALVPAREQRSRAELHHRFEKAYRDSGLEAEAGRESQEATDTGAGTQTTRLSPAAEAGSAAATTNQPE